MRRPRTLFIVGAGASVDFGFPIGSGLQEEIREFLKCRRDQPDGLNEGIRAAIQEIEQRGLTYREIFDCCDWMSKTLSLYSSIDSFLDKQSRPGDAVSYIGKLAIASIISRREHSSILHGSIDEIDWVSISKTWLGRLWVLMNGGGKERKIENPLHNVSFVTFNYDRCIERFINLCVSQSYGISLSEAKEISKNVPVEHVYGSLGDSYSDNGSEGFGACSYPGQCLPLVEKIRTFTEQVESEAAERIGALISKADRVFFLGFSFGAINRNFIDQFRSEAGRVKAVHGTGFKMSSDDRRIAENWADACFRRGSSGAEFRNMECAEFFDSNNLMFQ